MKYKAIILDVDETLMPNKVDGYPSSRVTASIIKAKEKLHVGVASARTVAYASHLFDHLQLSGPFILLGGCYIVDAQSKKILSKHAIANEDLHEICKILKKTKRNFFLDELDRKITFNSSRPPKDILNIYIPDLDLELADSIKLTLSHLSNINVHTATDWGNNRFALNISHAQVSKQRAILELANILGISTEEIIGVGDGYNDFPLLMACGLKIAMGNAVPELKVIADYIAPPVEEDGVAEVIEKFVLS